MTTTAPQPVSSPTTASPTPRSHQGLSRQVLAGLAATLMVAGGIAAYFAVTTTATPTGSSGTTTQPVTAGGVDVIERSASAQTTTPGGVDVIERSAAGQGLTPPMANPGGGSTVTAESAAAASPSHWANTTTQTPADTQIAQWTAATRDGTASVDDGYGSHWNNTTTGAPATAGGVDVIERQGCSVQCLAAQARLESHSK